LSALGLQAEQHPAPVHAPGDNSFQLQTIHSPVGATSSETRPWNATSPGKKVDCISAYDCSQLRRPELPQRTDSAAISLPWNTNGPWLHVQLLNDGWEGVFSTDSFPVIPLCLLVWLFRLSTEGLQPDAINKHKATIVTAFQAEKIGFLASLSGYSGYLGVTRLERSACYQLHHQA
jgi:hypothetical protein